MICRHCRTDTVEWVGPIADLGANGTRCRSCGRRNCQQEPEPEEGDACPECRTVGLAFKPGGDCSCHIAPPCWACTNSRLTCDDCGWQGEVVK